MRPVLSVCAWPGVANQTLRRIIDNLPAATKFLDMDQNTVYSLGFPLGFVGNLQVGVNALAVMCPSVRAMNCFPTHSVTRSVSGGVNKTWETVLEQPLALQNPLPHGADRCVRIHSSENPELTVSAPRLQRLAHRWL